MSGGLLDVICYSKFDCNRFMGFRVRDLKKCHIRPMAVWLLQQCHALPCYTVITIHSCIA